MTFLTLKKFLPIDPNCQDVQRLFQKWQERCIGPDNGKVMFDRLSLEVKQFNEIHASNGGKAFLQQYKLEVEYKTGLPDDSFEPPAAKVTKISDHVCSLYPSSSHTFDGKSPQTVMSNQ